MAGKKKGAKKGKKGGKKSGGGRAHTILDGLPMSSMTRDQLEGHVSRLKSEVDKERDERNYLQLELERLQRLWEVATHNLDHERSIARLKDAEIAAAEESHLQQMKVLQHKMKNLAGEQEDSIADLQVNNQRTLLAMRESNLSTEREMASELQQLRDRLMTSEANYLSVIANMKVDHCRAIQEHRESLLQEAQSLHSKQEENLRAVIQSLELKRITELQEQESSKNDFLEEVMKKHEETILELKKYYTDITEGNLKEIAELKQSISEKASQEGKVMRRIDALENERQKLLNDNKRLQQEVCESSKALKRSLSLQQNLKTSSARITSLTEHNENLQWEIEVLKQKIEKMEGERDALYSQLVSVVGEVKQRSETKNLLLEQKLAQVSDQLDKREAVLSEVLAATNMDPASVEQVTRQLEGIIEGKNRTIQELKTEVASVRKAYADTLRKPTHKIRK